jgi:hypothetical protein
LSKSLSIWAVIFVAGIITLLGYIALVVPGIILEIMYSLVLPVIIIEGLGFKSMKRSRELVRHRWLKTLVLYVVLGLILEIPAVIALTIISFTGFPAPIVDDIVMGFVLPIVPISFTVYYYSNIARITFPASSQSLTFPAIQVEPMYFCPHCGQKTISPDSKFCSNCGRVLRT